MEMMGSGVKIIIIIILKKEKSTVKHMRKTRMFCTAKQGVAHIALDKTILALPVQH